MATASLPMYDMDATRDSNDVFWAALARELRRHGFSGVPDQLTRGCAVSELWDDPDLFFSQCCGFDVIARHKETLRPIATPLYSAPGCSDGNYSSQIIVRQHSPFKDVRDMIGTRAAINGPESHSGMSALRHLISQRHGAGDFFATLTVSGSHFASLELVQNGQVDVAAIDSVTLALLQIKYPETLDGIKVLGSTYPAPAPPFVVSAQMPEAQVVQVQNALQKVFEDEKLAPCRTRLLLKGVTLTTAEDYWVLEAFQDHAIKRGFMMVG